MTKRLNKDDVKAKKKHHESRAKFYSKKLKDIESKEKRVGFKWYD